MIHANIVPMIGHCQASVAQLWNTIRFGTFVIVAPIFLRFPSCVLYDGG
jgi:hypothetical protein